MYSPFIKYLYILIWFWLKAHEKNTQIHHKFYRNIFSFLSKKDSKYKTVQFLKSELADEWSTDSTVSKSNWKKKSASL